MDVAESDPLYRNMLRPTCVTMPNSITYDFLLVFHSNYSCIWYTVSEINGDICKIFPPLIVNDPAEGFPFEFVTADGVEKIRMISLPECHGSVTMCPFVFDTVPTLDRQTDRRTYRQTDTGKTISGSACIAC